MTISVIQLLAILEYKANFFAPFFLPKIIVTTTNFFINGSSLHGSHQIIIFVAKNSDKSRGGSVTPELLWIENFSFSLDDIDQGQLIGGCGWSYLLVLRMTVKNIEGWKRCKRLLLINEPLVKPRFYSPCPPPPLLKISSSSFRIVSQALWNTPYTFV